MITPNKRKPILLRLTGGLEQAISERANQMGVNRHSYIVMVLTEHVKSSPTVAPVGERR